MQFWYSNLLFDAVHAVVFLIQSTQVISEILI